MAHASRASLPAIRHRDAGRLAPYAASLTADYQQVNEETRVRVKMAERQRRRDATAREALRKQVVQMALQEARELEQPREVAAVLEQQKRYLAAVGAQHADDRHAHMRSRLYQRFYEPTSFEVAEREENWQRRRAEHRLQRDARLSQIHVRAAQHTLCQSNSLTLLPATSRLGRLLTRSLFSPMPSRGRPSSPRAPPCWQRRRRSACLVRGSGLASD